MIDNRAFFDAMLEAEKLEQARSAIDQFASRPEVEHVPFGDRENNIGSIEVASDAARSLIERVTNAHDAVLEYQFEKHGGSPKCCNPREAAAAWLGVPTVSGLSGLTTKQRQDLAESAVVRLEPGEGWQSRILTVQDQGIGIAPADMSSTILSLNENNKISKHYLAGTYGQGGSSTLAFCKCVFIASRLEGSDKIAFTVARYHDLPAENFKTGRYVYLVENGQIPVISANESDFAHGTIIRHFGFDLTRYTSRIGPQSLYGALQRILFDPVSPIRFENEVGSFNRTIKGARNALNGAVDAGDDDSKGPSLDHNMPMFSLSLGDLGNIGIEYWVLSRPSPKKGSRPSKPSRGFVDDKKPIILTHNGQNQDEMSGRLIAKAADLPFLQTQGRLIVHVNCDRLSPLAKRQLFSSTREQAREGQLKDMIEREVVEVLKSDDELKRLNEEAREQSLKEKDEVAEKQMQRQVARMLRLVGPAVAEVQGNKDDEGKPPRPPRPPKPKPEPIETVDPPTFIRIVGDPEKPLRFYGGQRRYIRVETDANSSYHDPDDDEASKVNIVLGDDLTKRGTSPLAGGRMRLFIEAGSDCAVGSKGSIRIELRRTGLPTLSDEKEFLIVDPPQPKAGGDQSSFPAFKVIPVSGPDDGDWLYVTDGQEDYQVKRHASGVQMDDDTLLIYYSERFPRFDSEKRRIQQRNAALLPSFVRRYEMWIAVHALLAREDELQLEEDFDEEAVQELGRLERCRLASMASMMASQEVLSGAIKDDFEDVA